jgi:acetyl esterase/lipase
MAPTRLLRLLWLATAAASCALLTPASAGAAYSAELDVPYVAGGNPLQRLDIYRPSPAPASPAPVVVWVHGGGWSVGDKSNRIPDKARLFTDAGYVFVSVNYRLSPNPPDIADPGRIRFPVHPHDVTSALKWLGAGIPSRGGDPSRILLVGHSAGAQIVSLLGADGRFLRDRGVDPLAIRGFVSLDTESFDIARDANPATSTRNARAQLMMQNAFATPAENAVDGAWEAGSPLGKGDRLDPPALFVTQARSADRIAANQAMAADLDLDPADAVLPVPLDHEGISTSLGSPTDTTGETAAVIGFANQVLAETQPLRTKLRKKPPAKVKARGKRAKVRFRFETSDPRATFECRLDKKPWKACASPRAYKVKAGKHQFRVRAENRDGDGAPKKHTFRVKR